MTAAIAPADPFRTKPLVGGLHDKSRPPLNPPGYFSEIQNVTFRGDSSKERFGAVPFVRSLPKGSSLQLRSDVQPVGRNAGNQNWNSYIAIPNSPAFRLGLASTAWTVELMAYLDKYSSFADQELLCRVGGAIATAALRVYITAANKIAVDHRDGAGAVVTITSAADFPLQSERMVTIRRGGNAGSDATNLEVLLDGVVFAGGTASISTTATDPTYGMTQIGRANPGTTGPDFGFFGRVSEMRFWSKARSDANITANIRKQIDVATDEAELFAYYPLNKGTKFELVDESNHGQSAFLAPYIPRSTKFGSPAKDAYFFDGAYSRLEIGDTGNSRAFTQMAKNFTAANNRQFAIEVGWTPAATPLNGTAHYILDARNLCEIFIDDARRINVQFYDGAVASTLLTSTSFVDPGQRYMISVSRTNATGRLYVNGVQEATSGAMANTVDITYANAVFTIGARIAATGNDRHAPGWLDEFRIWNQDISASATFLTYFDSKLPEANDTLGSGGGLEAQFLTFQMSKVVRVVQGSATVTTVGGAGNSHYGNIGFNGDVRRSFMVVRDNLEPLTVENTELYHVNAIASNTQVTLSDVYDYGTGAFTIDGRAVQWTKLAFYLDISKNSLDPDVVPIRTRLQKAGGSQVWFMSHVRAEASGSGDPDFDVRKIRGVMTTFGAINAADTAISAGLMSPREALPQFKQGFFAAPEEPVTGLTYWSQPSGSRFVIGAHNRFLSWVNPRWSRDRPFSYDKDPSGYSLQFVTRKDDIRIPHGASKGVDFPAAANRTWDFWIKPISVSGIGYILSKSTAASIFEYLIYIEDGRLKISWHSNGGANQITVSTLGSVLRTDQWQHVSIVAEQTGGIVNIYVNGDRRFTSLTGSVAGAASTNSNDLYIGRNGVNSGQSFLGWIDDLRVSNTLRQTGTTFKVPVQPQTDDANTIILMPFSEGRDVIVKDTGTLDGLTPAHGVLESDPWIPLVTDLEVSDLDHPSVFGINRNNLFRTDGKNYPVRIDWSGNFADTNYGFNVTRMGIKAPNAPPEFVSIETPVATSMPIPPNSLFAFYYTYYNSKKGVESGPSPKGTYTTGNPAGGGDGHRNLIISVSPPDDPQVDMIRVYFTTGGGSIAHLVGETPSVSVSLTNQDFALEREALQFLLNQTGPTIAAGQELSFDNGEAPTARYLRFEGEYCHMARTDALPTGFFSSQPGVVESFSPLDVQNLDAPNGGPITGLSSSLGRVYGHQKAALWVIQPGEEFANFSFDLSQVDQGALSGLSIVNVGGYDYFRGDRGVMRFSGSGVDDISRDIAGTYKGREDDTANFPGLDQLAIENSCGVNHKAESELWWTCRKLGEARNSRIITYDLETEGNPWSSYLGLEYSIIAAGEDELGANRIYGGTYTGYVYVLDIGQIDGSSKPTQLDNSTPIVTGTVGSFSGDLKTVTIAAGVLDTLGDGYKGLFLTVLNRDAKSKVTTLERKRIVSSTSTTITVESAFSSSSFTTWIVGAIEAYVVSGWHDFGTSELSHLFHYFDTTFRPSSGSFFDLHWEVAYQSPDSLADLFSRTNAKNARVSMNKGYTAGLPLDSKNRGRFFRFQLYSVDSGVQPEWYDAGIRAAPEGVGHGG